MSCILADSLRTWGSAAFAATLKRELSALPSGSLPLARATTQGGQVDDRDLAITVLGASDDTDGLRARVGVFFTEIVPSCSCGDDPLEVNAYCVLRIDIDRGTAAAAFTIVADASA